MQKLVTFVGLVAASATLSGCAYMTAKQVSPSNAESIDGIPFFAPKAYLVVNGTGTSTIVVPDCSKEYRLQFGSVLAKHKAKVDFSNGIITSIDSDQDSTAVPLALVQLVKDAAVAGKSIGGAFSSKADGGPQDRFGVFEVSCDANGLSLTESVAKDLPQMKSAPNTATLTVPAVPAAQGGASAEGADLPKSR
jgi:hypothetical protein